MTDQKTGYFFNTTEECARLMVRLSEHTPKDIIDNAHDLARNSFSEESYGKEIMKIYRSLIA